MFNPAEVLTVLSTQRRLNSISYLTAYTKSVREGIMNLSCLESRNEGFWVLNTKFGTEPKVHTL